MEKKNNNNNPLRNIHTRAETRAKHHEDDNLVNYNKVEEMKWNNENNDAPSLGEKWLSALINWLNWWRIQFFKPPELKARFIPL